MSTEKRTCLKVSFSGRVQGVGFRWTTKKIAETFAVTGYVKNMMDGSVEMVVEGESSEAQKFLSSLRERMTEYVESCEVIEYADSPGYDYFMITY